MFKGFLNRISVLIIIILLFTGFVLGCAANPQSPNPPTYTPTPKEDLRDFIPLKVGNKWEYEGEGNEYASFKQEVEFQKDNRFQLSLDSGGTVMANIFEVREDSIANVYRSGEEYERKNLLDKPDNLDIVLIKQPIEIGNKWISEENTYEIVETAAKVTVPYGTFDQCVVVRLVFKDGSESLLYYKKGIGLLQSEFSSEGSKIYSRLKSFTSK